MMTPQRLLVPMDFSDYASRALDYAMAFAQPLQAHVILLHVVQALPQAGQDRGPTFPHAYIATLEAELTHYMEDYLQRVKAAGLAGHIIMAHGVPFQKTIETAQAQHIDLIIMGSHGRTGLRHVLLGSMAEKVMRLAPCPVLIVR